MKPKQTMKQRNTQFLAGTFVLALGMAVYGQDQAPATPEKAAAPAAASPVGAPDTAAPAGKSSVRFEGTDLHLGSLPPITFHGFGSQGFLYSSGYNYLGDTTRGSGKFTEMGLNASVSPFDRTRIAVQGFAYATGDIGKYEPFLDYASVEYTFNDAIGLRGGRIRRPGGIYNHIQDVDLARTSVLLPQGMYDARWRDFFMSIDGGTVFGNLRLGQAGSLSYELYGGYANVSDQGGIAAKVMNGQPANISLGSMESPLFLGGQLWWSTPVSGLRAGVGGGQASDLAANLDVATPLGAGTSRLLGNFPYYQLSLRAHPFWSPTPCATGV